MRRKIGAGRRFQHGDIVGLGGMKEQRATDDKGNTQPDVSAQKWNQLGYIFAAMVPHPVKVA